MNLTEHIKNIIKDKKVLIMGFGREGRSTYRVIKKIGGYAELAISDMNPVKDVEEKVFSGVDYQKAADDFDIIFKSPGVVLENSANVPKVTAQTDEIMHCYRDRMVGITGTKGKSTTTTLIYHILKCAGKNPILMGNIGIPAFDAIEDADENSFIVYELSCHQLEYARTSPKYGVLLNIFPEHLDHYGTFEKYRAAKENVYRNMKKGDMLFCEKSIEDNNAVCDTVTFSMEDDSADYKAVDGGVLNNGKAIEFGKHVKSLFGIHNMYNISVAYGVCTKLGVSDGEFMKALESFKSLPHRLEMFAEINGVRYFDDSISTIPETTVQALSSIENVGTLILGGMDRKISLDYLVEFLIKKPVPRIILIPDTGNILFEQLDGKIKSELIKASDLYEAARVAKEITLKGEACVLSPAAASYGFFKNFEERGDEFKKTIKGC